MGTSSVSYSVTVSPALEGGKVQASLWVDL